MRLAEHHRVHDLLVGHRPGHRLAHLDVVERLLVHVHAEIHHRILDRRADDGELRRGLELGEVLGRQVERDVGIATLEERAAVAGRGDDTLDDATDLGQRPVLPLVVAHEHDFLAGLPALDLVGAASGEVVLAPFHRPGVGGGRILLAQLGVHDHRHRHADVGHGELVGAQEIDAEGAVVDDDELFLLLERASRHLEGREAADRDGAVERPLHVLGRDRRAVVELGVLAQLEGGRRRRHVPVGREFGLELGVVVMVVAVGVLLDAVGDQPVMGVPRHFVGRPVGADAMDIHRVGWALRDEQERLITGLRLGFRPDCGRDGGGGAGNGRRLHE